MDFKVYQIFEDINFEGRETELRDYLINSDFFEGDHGLNYVINNDVELENGVLTGTLSEEFIPNSYSVDDDKSISVMDDIEPYERTFFALDFNTRAFLVQNRKYSPTNLKPGKSLNRLIEIFGDAFNNVFNAGFTLIPVLLPEGNDLFLTLFNNHRVVEIKVSNLNERTAFNDGHELSDDEEENNFIKTLWNEDSSLMDSIVLKTTSEGDLNDNIFAHAALSSPNCIIEKIKYFDPEEDGFVTKTRSSFDKFPIPNLDRNVESITAFQTIINAVNENRALLRRMRQIRD
ncbi:hypothetical protein [Cytobacillus firmus]|uniref:Uncharacterized protein n=1 Tax=Cytobacillus firmus DS1 TaxID=1307436 RepID=W7KY97_CYTFI|nr:hypothetical protein [Cytobacillus firmus]EWG08321.1 hypothetical protein PBF_24859 [Cytobacillus firmus DS1]